MLKMLGRYLLGQNCLHLTLYPYLRSETYSRKHEKLPNIVIHACKILQKKLICWKCVARKFNFVYLHFGPLRWNRAKLLTTIVTLSWIGGVEVTHLLWVQDFPVSIPGSGKGFYVWFIFVLLLLCFYFLSQNTLFITKICNSFHNINLFSILNILQDVWPIIGVLIYRSSIFKEAELTWGK